jgi:formylglycine-generating enzyme required for sulfatase activity
LPTETAIPTSDPTPESPQAGEKPSDAVASTEGMVLIPGGTYAMGWGLQGSDWPAGGITDDEGPVHEVRVDSFYIDIDEVTNAEFERFVDTTGYVTDAERNRGSFVVAVGVAAELDPGWYPA